VQNELWGAWAKGGRISIKRIPIHQVLAKVPGGSSADKARKIGVSRQVVWMWETGRTRPGWKSCQRLAELTGVNAEDIFGRVIHAGK
jgi:DNA-binding XRE family transcriptional regulator